MTSPRVVSLIASATEIVAALGFEDSLVGRSHECDFPGAVERLPACTRPKLDISASSREIDRQVKDLLRAALSVYEVDADRLATLAPDLIVTQTQCEVCAASLADVERALACWVGPAVRVVSLEPNALADVWADIRRVADALSAPQAGAALVERLQARMTEIVEITRTVRHRPTVACIEWVDPLMAAGNWMPELVEMAGGADLFGEAGRHSPWMEWEALAAADPEVIVILPCGFDMARTRQELPALTGRPGWNRLRAVRQDRVYVTDGNQYFNRPGPRLAESLEILAELLHPEAFDFGHRGRGWEPL